MNHPAYCFTCFSTSGEHVHGCPDREPDPEPPEEEWPPLPEEGDPGPGSEE